MQEKSNHTFCMDMLTDVGEGQLRQMNPIKKNTNVQYFVISVMGPNIPIYDKLRVPVATPSKEQVSDRPAVKTVFSNPPGSMDVCRECCVLSGRGLWDELSARPEESYQLCCVVVCDLENS